MTAAQWILSRYNSRLSQTRTGLQLRETSESGGLDCAGIEYTHLFFDQFGNSLISAIPQGIAGREYVVHVIFPVPVSDTTLVTYSVNQTAGVFLDAVVYRDAGFEINSESRVEERYVWKETVTVLRPATSDIEFEIVRTSYQSLKEGSPIAAGDNVVVACRQINMSPVYAASFGFGILNSSLRDPVYSLVPLDSDSISVLDVSEDGDRYVLTAMVTLYTSPVVLLQSLCGKDFPSYKLFGRNFLDDHEWYQRFYPTFGLILGSSTLENVFLGLDFEITRAMSLFGGYHFGKVSKMDLPEGFVPGVTPMSEGEFTLSADEEWESEFAYGLTLDLGILTKLIDR